MHKASVRATFTSGLKAPDEDRPQLAAAIARILPVVLVFIPRCL